MYDVCMQDVGAQIFEAASGGRVVAVSAGLAKVARMLRGDEQQLQAHRKTLNWQSVTGSSALHAACWAGHVDVAAVLLHAGVDVLVKDAVRNLLEIFTSGWKSVQSLKSFSVDWERAHLP